MSGYAITLFVDVIQKSVSTCQGRISTMWRETTAQDAGAQLIDGIERGQFYLHLPRRFTNSMRLARRLPYRLYVWLIHKMTG